MTKTKLVLLAPNFASSMWRHIHTILHVTHTLSFRLNTHSSRVDDFTHKIPLKPDCFPSTQIQQYLPGLTDAAPKPLTSLFSSASTSDYFTIQL